MNMNSTAPRAPSPPDVPVQVLWEEQVARNPSAAAITFEGEMISYGELDARANQIAAALIGAGLAPRQPVAILLSDGPRQIAALLGVLKAGGVLVCLDATSPTKRRSAAMSSPESKRPCIIRFRRRAGIARSICSSVSSGISVI